MESLALFVDDHARDERRSGSKARREAASDAKADDRAGARGGGFKVALQPSAVSPPRQNKDLRPRGELSLRLQPGDGDDERTARGKTGYIPTGAER